MDGSVIVAAKLKIFCKTSLGRTGSMFNHKGVAKWHADENRRRLEQIYGTVDFRESFTA